jgi:hypothetical protein
MERKTRDRRLTPEEVAKNKQVIQAIEQELPALIARHKERMKKKEARKAADFKFDEFDGTKD